MGIRENCKSEDGFEAMDEGKTPYHFRGAVHSEKRELTRARGMRRVKSAPVQEKTFGSWGGDYGSQVDRVRKGVKKSALKLDEEQRGSERPAPILSQLGTGESKSDVTLAGGALRRPPGE